MNRARWVIGTVGVLLAAALVYDGAAHRYAVTSLGGRAIVRTDRLTGRTDTCRYHYADSSGYTFQCEPTVATTR